MKIYECTEELFLKDVENHKMIVFKDDGVYRHLRFKREDSSAYYFDIVTYPNTLVISGDMGAAAYSRLYDMFEFFRTDSRYQNKDGLAINPQYWGEKLICGREDFKKFCPEECKKVAHEIISDMADNDWTEEEIEELKIHFDDEISCVDENDVRMFDFMTEYQFRKEGKSYMDDPDFEFTDWWDMHSSTEVYTFHYLWRSYAIAYAVKQYDLFKQEK
jgi:hypothetical protein